MIDRISFWIEDDLLRYSCQAVSCIQCLLLLYVIRVLVAFETSVVPVK